MIATREPARVGLLHPAEPAPPDLRFVARADACAVTMTFNGVAYRAVLDLDGRGMAVAGEVAGMLRKMADQVEAK